MRIDTTTLLRNVFKYATYDEQTKTYKLSKESYKKLNLNHNKRKKIQEACDELGIILEYPKKALPDIKGEELFPEYNYIKSKLETTINLEEKSILEQRRIAIRNQIFEYNMELIETIINRKINNIELLDNNVSIEDLYQIGYEILLKYIDSHYLESEKFKYEISSTLILRLKKALYNQRGIAIETAIKLIELKNILETSPSSISIKDLSTQLNIEESRTKNLLNLNNILNCITLSETDIKDEQLTEHQISLEESLIAKQQEEHLLRIIETLTGDTKKKVIILSLGFNGERVHTNEEIAARLGDTKGTISNQRTKALEQLSFPTRIKYIKQILNIDDKTNKDDEQPLKMTPEEQKVFRRLELFLLKQLDKNTLEILTTGLNPKYKEVLLTYLGYIESKQSISRHLYKIEYSLNHIIEKITELYVDNNKNEEIKDYFDYLMYNYLNKPKVRSRIK